MSNYNGGPAFPTVEQFNSDGSVAVYAEPGMSLRQYFAAKALQGMLADTSLQADYQEFAHRAYRLADAMLKEGLSETSD